LDYGGNSIWRSLIGKGLSNGLIPGLIRGLETKGLKIGLGPWKGGLGLLEIGA